ncbi:MAG: hypothetical protein COV52_03990, partial [Gammaproteobacteria bacterium CG11_big_fil_rev_8_21_14_0_20_46_22]
MLNKRLILTAMVALPLTLFAASSTPVSGDSGNQYNPKTNPTGTYNPMYSPDENAESSTLNFNSGMFGYQGPLSIDTTYSKDYGVIVKGQFTHTLGDRQAYSLIAEGGGKQYRFNGTWGMMLSKRQELKVSLDHLAQKMDFSFASGDSRDWVSQNALGLTYQFLLHQGWLRAFNVNGFVSKANSKNLNSRDYVGDDGFTYRNDRRIAGGEERSVQAGLTFLPTRWTAVDTTVNYQSVRYPMDYESSTNNSSGFGFGVSAHQIITHHLKANLSFERDQTQTSIDGGFEVLLPSPHGTSLDMKLDTQRVIGRNGGNSDTQYTAGFDFRWGVTGKPSFSLSQADSLGDLNSFVSQPAVYMNQVLAVKDERSVRLNNTPSPNVKSAASNAGNVITIPVNPKKPVSVSIANYLPQALAQGKQALSLSAEGLPKSLHYDAATETISGQWPTQKLKGKAQALPEVDVSLMQTIVRPGFANVTAHTKLSDNQIPVLNVDLVGTVQAWLKVNPTGPKSLIISNPQSFSMDVPLDTTQTTGNTTALFFYQLKGTSFEAGNFMDVNWNTPGGQAPAGMSCSYFHPALGQEYMRCAGTNVTPGDYSANITYTEAGQTFHGDATISNFSFKIENPDHPPIRNSTANPGNLTLNPGDAVKVGGSNLDYSHYYTVPVSDPMSIDASKTAQLSVSYTPTNGSPQTPTTLAASHLGQSLSLSGLSLQGSVPASAPSGLYTITARPVNNLGAAEGTVVLGIYVTGPPVYTGTAPTPASASKNGGEPLGTVQFANSFVNPQGTSNTVLDPAASTVSFNGGSAIAFSTSAFKNLTVSGMNLSGTIPSSGISVGTYMFKMYAKNSTGKTSASPATFTLTINAVPTAPQRTSKSVPAQSPISGGASIQSV